MSLCTYGVDTIADARQAWRYGLSARVQAVEALIRTVRAERPTPMLVSDGGLDWPEPESTPAKGEEETEHDQ